MKLNLPLLSFLTLGAAAISYARAEDPAPATAENLQQAHNNADAERDGPRRDPEKMKQHRMKMLDEKLQLTADQKAQIQAIWDKAGEQAKALRSDETVAHDDRRAKAGELMKATHDQVRAVLTPDQQKTFDAMPPERMGRRGPRPAGDKPADAPAPPPQS
ncbi:MAG: hypothetical protein JWM35_1032 [Verrucomicrobia bacterium]|nr:hypothetical protein [Verrucomicrobiota bacterium]